MSPAPKTALAVFVKTPGLSSIKTRLAAGIGEKAAQEFYLLSLKAVENTLQKIDADVFWAIGEKNGLNHPLWNNFQTLHTGEGDLGQRQHHIYETLLKNHDCALLIGADCPQISPEILEQAITILNAHDFVIGPARDGGYYLFGGRLPVNKTIWESVPWSVDTTREKLEALLPSQPFHLPPLSDVDTKDNLQSLQSEMPAMTSNEQNRLLKWIEKL